MITIVDADLAIPACLIIPQAERNAEWRGRKLTQVRAEAKARGGLDLPREIEPEGRALLRQQEADRKRRTAERLAKLRERHC